MNFFKSFYFAGRGIVTALGQRNFRFHLCAAAFVIFIAARFYSFTAERWAILALTIAAVLGLEAVNTGIEKLADKVTEEHSHRIKLAKDCAAGGVLIAALGAAAVGIALFWNTDVLGLIFLYFTEPARLAALIMALALAWGFVFLPEYWNKQK